MEIFRICSGFAFAFYRSHYIHIGRRTTTTTTADTNITVTKRWITYLFGIVIVVVAATVVVFIVITAPQHSLTSMILHTQQTTAKRIERETGWERGQKKINTRRSIGVVFVYLGWNLNSNITSTLMLNRFFLFCFYFIRFFALSFFSHALWVWVCVAKVISSIISW